MDVGNRRPGNPGAGVPGQLAGDETDQCAAVVGAEELYFAGATPLMAQDPGYTIDSVAFRSNEIELRAALYNHPLPALRPPADDNGCFHHVPGVLDRIRRSVQSEISLPDEFLFRLRNNDGDLRCRWKPNRAFGSRDFL